MSTYNYSYNVLINRFEAFAAGHLLIKRFTHGQIDLSDQLNDDQYPFMHVTPDTIEPTKGAMQFGFHIMFADIPRDKETKAEYQREVISDCVRLGQDLIAEITNGLTLFGFNVQMIGDVVFEPFMEEQKNTVTGVAFTIKLEVPWDWSACDIPAVWAVGGESTGGSGTPVGILLQVNNVNNAVQSELDLVAGDNITLTDNGNGSVTIDALGGTSFYAALEFNTNHTTAQGNPYLIGNTVWYNGNVYTCIANNDAILPTNTSYWTLQGAGFRIRQNVVDWNATSGDYQILNKPTIPAAQVNSDWNAVSGVAEILNKPTIPAAQVNSDWNAVSGVAQILNKPSLATVATTGSYTDLINQPSIPPAQVNSDWNASSGVAQILNKPTIPAAQVNSDWNSVSGVSQILNKPTIPAAQVNSDWNAVSGVAQILNKPTIPTTLDTLTDVNAPTPTLSDILFYNGTEWINSPIKTVAENNINLTNLNDVNIVSPSTGQALILQSSGQWQNQTIPGGSPTGAAGGDLQGTYPNPIVHQIHGIEMQSGTPTVGDVWLYEGAPAKWQHQPLPAVHVVNDSSVTGSKVKDALNHLDSTKQATLVSGTNIKTLEGQSLLGSGNIDLTKADVGLGNVDNTSDLNKPISTATQTALNAKQDLVGFTTVGTNLATLPNPSAVRYLRINADNTISALTLAALKIDLGLGSTILASNISNAGTANYEDVTGLSFAVTANKVYKWRATIAYTNTANIAFALDGPAVTFNRYRFTSAGTTTANIVNNQSAYNLPAGTSAATNGVSTADGIIRPSANGTVIVRMRAAAIGGVTVLAGSIIEWEEVL